MRTKGNQNQEEEEYEDEEFGSRKDGPSSSVSANNNNNNSNSNKDGKNNDKASLIRSKHSVTEQRRRSKINERFQILRDLIPNSDQKRDTASFLLEVIEYVHFLQENVQKCEGSYAGWSHDSAKLMPWRNSHWRAQSLPGHSQAIKNGSGPGSIPGKLDESNINNIHPAMVTSTQNPVESEHSRDVCNATDQQAEVSNKFVSMTIPFPTKTSVCGQNEALMHPLQQPVSDAQSVECHSISDGLNQQDELTIEAGTIKISSAYSQGLLNSLTQALQTAGVDLSQANVSVQIDLGKRANRGAASGIFAAKDAQSPHLVRDGSSAEDYDQAQKRQKK